MKKTVIILIAAILLLATAGCSLLQKIPQILPVKDLTVREIGIHDIPSEGERKQVPILAPKETRVPVGTPFLEKDGLRILLDSYEVSGYAAVNGPVFHLTLYNETEQDIRVTARSVCLNSYEMQSDLDVRVPAGTEVQADMRIQERLYRELYFIVWPRELLADFVVWEAETETVLAEFYDISAKLPAMQEEEPPAYRDGGLVLLDSSQGEIVCMNGWYKDQQEAGYDLVLFASNQANTHLLMILKEVHLADGTRIPVEGSLTVRPGKKGFLSVFLSREELNAYGIGAREEAGGTVEIRTCAGLRGEQWNRGLFGEDRMDQMPLEAFPEQDYQEDTGFLLLNRENVTVRAGSPQQQYMGYVYYVPIRVKNDGTEKVRAGISEIYADGCLLERADIPLEIEGGTTADAQITLTLEDLKPYALEDVRNLTVRAYVEKTDGTRTEGEFLVVPLGGKEANRRVPQDGETVADTEQVYIRILKGEKTSSGTGRYTFFLENRTEGLMKIRLQEGEDILDTVWIPANGAAYRTYVLAYRTRKHGEGTEPLTFVLLDRWDHEIGSTESVSFLWK
ncbi:MAG: hypothetical protein II781_03565 [Clostridia bacterium]|nr:hypothetical protein [Clostridia bacterium]